MAKKKLTKTLWYGAEKDAEGNPIVPNIAPSVEKHLEGINEGEIYIYNGDEAPSFYIRTASGRVVSVGGVNVLSSHFLRKDEEDAAKYLITFDKGISIGDKKIYKSKDDVIFIDANVVVRGGITMYGTNATTSPTIWEGIPIDNDTIYWDNGVIKAKGEGFLTGITSQMVVDALGYTPLREHQTIYALTIQRNGVDVETYTPNSSKKTINILVPVKVSELENDSKFATTKDLDDRVSALVNGAPEALDTLKEIADVLEGNVDSIGDIITTLGTKAEKATTLGGYGITDAYTSSKVDELLKAVNDVIATKWTQDDEKIKNWDAAYGWGDHSKGGYAKKTYVDETFVTIAGTEDVTGVHDFTNGLKIGGIKIRESQDGVVYVEGNLVVKGGVTMYADDTVDVPSFMESLPTAGYDEFNARGLAAFNSSHFAITNGVVSIIGENVGLNESQLKDYLENNGYINSLEGYATQAWVGSTLSAYATQEWVTNKKYLTSIDKTLVIAALEFTPLDSAKWTKNEVKTLLGISDWALGATKPSYTTTEVTEGTNLYFTNKRAVDALGETLKSYVTLGGKQTITGEKDFTGGLKVNGSPIVYDVDKGYWYLTGDLIVSGGVTMFGNIGTYTPSTIMDGVVVDGVTIIKQNGKLVALGGGGGGSELDTVAWGNVLGKPDWITDAKPDFINPFSLSWNGRETGSYDGSVPKTFYIPTKLSELTDDVVSGKYLPLTGGTLSGNLNYNGSGDWIFNGQNHSIGFSNGKVAVNLAYNDNAFRPQQAYNNQILLGASNARWSNIYSVLGNFSGQITSSVATGTAPFNVSSTTLVSNLNADMLDGQHASRFIGLYTRADIGTAPNFDNPSVNGLFEIRPESGLPDATGGRPFNGNAPFFSIKAENVMMQIAGTSYFKAGWWIRGKQSANVTLEGTPWERLVTEDAMAREWGISVKGNAATATKLKTARKLWGNDFDGSKDLTGSLTLTNNTGIYWKKTDGTGNAFLHLNTNNEFHLGNSNYPSWLSGEYISLRYGASKIIGLVLNASGNVGIGTNAPEYKLDVNGDAMFRKSVYLPNARALYGLKTDGNFAAIAHVTASNNILIGSSDNPTHVRGTAIHLSYGNTNGLTLDANGQIRILNTLSVGSTSTFSGLTTHNNGLSVSGINIKKSQDGVLYIDGNLVVKGGITMYGTDATSSESIIDNLPIASTSAKGIAQFNPSFFSVSEGVVSIPYATTTTAGVSLFDTNYFTVSGGKVSLIPDNVGLNEERLGAYLSDKGYLTSSNFNSYAPKLDGTGATGIWNIDVNGSSTYLRRNGTKNLGLQDTLQICRGTYYGNEIDEWNTPYGLYKHNNTLFDFGLVMRVRYATNYYTDLWFDSNSGAGLNTISLRRNSNGKLTDWIHFLTNKNFATYINDSYLKKSGDTMSGVLTSTVANGTAPFVVSSKTLVSNLNADLLDGVQLNGLFTSAYYTAMQTDGIMPKIDITVGGVTKEVTLGYDSLVRKSFVFTSTSLSSYWVKVASVTLKPNFNVYAATLSVEEPYGNSRTVDGKNVFYGSSLVKWTCYVGLATQTPSTSVSILGSIPLKFRSYHSGAGNSTTFELWVDLERQHNGLAVTVLQETGRGYQTTPFIATYYNNQFSTVQPSTSLTTYVESQFDHIGNSSESATKLQTPRTLWGQSFNGTGNVSGDLTGVGNITATSSIAIISSNNGNIALRYNNDDTKSLALVDGTFRPFAAANWLINLGSTNSRWNGIYGQSLDVTGGIYGDNISLNSRGTLGTYKNIILGPNILSYNSTNGGYVIYSGLKENEAIRIDSLDKNGAWVTNGLRIMQNGYVGIGNINPTYNLHVQGSLGVTGASTFMAQTTHSAGLLSTTGSFSDSVTINGIKINKSQDGTLYINGNLVVSGGVTMYGTDATTTPSIFDSLPIASTSVKGIAQFDGSYFTVNNGLVSLIPENVGLNETKLNAYLTTNGYITSDALTTKLGDYALKTGTNASGTWGISVSGSSAVLQGVTSTSSVTISGLDRGQFVYRYNVKNGTTGLFNTNNDANAIIAMNRHHEGYWSQLGFSNDGRIYYRAANDDTTAWNKVAFTSDLNGYLPKSGGTITGVLGMAMTTDTSNEKGLTWYKTDGVTQIASITYHNTGKSIILNPIGSSYTYSDAEGKYSLVIGNNKLTYNTHYIYHKGLIDTLKTDLGLGSNAYTSTAYLPSASYTASDVLSKLKTVDGSGSGLDADMLDGCQLASFMTFLSRTNYVKATLNDSSLSTLATGDGYIEFWDSSANGFMNSQWGDITAFNITAKTAFIGSLTGNASSASKLNDDSSYTAWGQTFFSGGTPNSISGNMTGVGSISASGNIATSGNIVANGARVEANGSNGSAIGLFATGTTYSIGFIIGDGGVNRGIYDYYNGSWMLYRDSSADVYIPYGNLRLGSTAYIGSDANISGNANVSGYVKCGSAVFLQNGTYAELSSGGNEMILSGGANMYVNYRSSAYGRSVPSSWVWNAGSGSSYASFTIGGLTANGNILATGGITMYSQRSLKNVMDERGLSLKELRVIKPTRYTWKDGRDDRLHIGGIADDIEQVLPEVVYKNNDGVLTLDYGNAAFAIAASLIRPVIDHETRIERLERENRELKEEIERLKRA